MANNTSPVFVQNGHIEYVTLKDANVALTGVGNNVKLLLTSGLNGTYIDRIRLTSLGNNVSTVFRLFINNGQDKEIETNNSLIYEYELPVTTTSESAKIPEHDLIINMSLQAQYRLYCTISLPVISGWSVTCISGDF